jgi:selenocysteine-specific elongation factor
VTIGGGRVVNPFPGRRHRRFRADVIERLETLAHGTPEEILLQDLERRQPCEVRDLYRHSNLSSEQARESLGLLLRDGQAFVLDSGLAADSGRPAVRDASFLITRSGWGALRERMESLLGGYHSQYPLRGGMPREEVKSRLAPYVAQLTSRLFNEIVEQAVREGWLAEAGGAIRLASHQITFNAKQQQAVDYLLYTFRQEPYTTPSVAQCEEQVGSEVLSALVEQGDLIKLGDDVIFMTETYDEMVNRVVAHLKEQGTITVAQMRDMFGTSRKYALAFLGHLDEKRITRRVGDERVLR